MKRESRTHLQQECPKEALAIALEMHDVDTTMLQLEDKEADKEDTEELTSRGFLPPPIQLFQLIITEQIAGNNEENRHMEQIDIVICALEQRYTLPVWNSL